MPNQEPPPPIPGQPTPPVVCDPAPMNWIERIFVTNAMKKWLTNNTVTAHSIAAVFAVLVLLYAQVPAFTNLCNSLYTQSPTWLHEWILAVIGVLAWYAKTHKETA